MGEYILVMQCSLVRYRGICYASLVFSRVSTVLENWQSKIKGRGKSLDFGFGP